MPPHERAVTGLGRGSGQGQAVGAACGRAGPSAPAARAVRVLNRRAMPVRPRRGAAHAAEPRC